MDSKMHYVTGRVRAMRINNNVLPAYREFCRRNYEWLDGKFPIHNPCEGVSDELWIRRRLKSFRNEEVGGGGGELVTTWLVFINDYIMGVIRIRPEIYDVDDFRNNLVSNVEFCVDREFRGGDASYSVCELAIHLAFQDALDGEDIIVVYPIGHKAMPRIMETVLANNELFNGVPISGRSEDGKDVVGYSIAKAEDYANPARFIKADESKEIFG